MGKKVYTPSEQRRCTKSDCFLSREVATHFIHGIRSASASYSSAALTECFRNVTDYISCCNHSLNMQRFVAFAFSLIIKKPIIRNKLLLLLEIAKKSYVV